MLQVAVRHFIKNDSGAISILYGLVATTMIGMIGLGVDAGMWYNSQRDLQSLSDAVTLSAARSISGTSTQQQLQTAVTTELARNGYSSGISATVNYPPTSGALTGVANSVEVKLTSSKQLFFSKLFSAGTNLATTNIASRSVAKKLAGGEVCVLALNNSASGSVSFQGTADVSVINCIVAANSNNSSALIMSGDSSLIAESLYLVGNYSQGSNATLNLESSVVTDATALVDPYQSLTIPSYSSCDETNYRASGTRTISPGVYCNGLDVNAGANVTMESGVYIIDRGDFVVNGSATVNGTGITIILTSSTGSNYGSATINGGAVMNLYAPTSGTYSGILFYEDRNTTSTHRNKLNGGSTTNLVGALYFPKTQVEFTGGNTTTGSCTQIIADTVTFTGNAGVQSSCAAANGMDEVKTESVITLEE